ncbi:MAG: hypothetical protein ACM3TR_04845 [Caulobacteraceae bacterium]
MAKYLKPFILLILLIVGLLFVQALCDLALPDYISYIVNVGIQQGGIKNAVPEVIRKNELEKLKLFMDDDSRRLVDENYVPEQQEVYKLNTKDKTVLDKLNTVFGKPMLIVSGIEKEGLTNLPESQLNAMMEKAAEKLNNMPESMITQAAVAYIHKEYGTIGVDTDKLQTDYIITTQASICC